MNVSGIVGYLKTEKEQH